MFFPFDREELRKDGQNSVLGNSLSPQHCCLLKSYQNPCFSVLQAHLLGWFLRWRDWLARTLRRSNIAGLRAKQTHCPLDLREVGFFSTSFCSSTKWGPVLDTWLDCVNGE